MAQDDAAQDQHTAQKGLDTHGNEIIRSFDGGTDRYAFDFDHCTAEDGWLQFDTNEDAHYFGIWVHKEKQQIVQYMEGDISQTQCASAETFNAAIADMCAAYSKAAHIRTISEDGTYTKYYQDREQFFITEPEAEADTGNARESAIDIEH